MVERQLPKLHTGVRFPSPALLPNADVKEGYQQTLQIVWFAVFMQIYTVSAFELSERCLT